MWSHPASLNYSIQTRSSNAQEVAASSSFALWNHLAFQSGRLSSAFCRFRTAKSLRHSAWQLRFLEWANNRIKGFNDQWNVWNITVMPMRIWQNWVALNSQSQHARENVSISIFYYLTVFSMTVSSHESCGSPRLFEAPIINLQSKGFLAKVKD